jgi:hypothetical protein
MIPKLPATPILTAHQREVLTGLSYDRRQKRSPETCEVIPFLPLNPS